MGSEQVRRHYMISLTGTGEVKNEQSMLFHPLFIFPYRIWGPRNGLA